MNQPASPPARQPVSPPAANQPHSVATHSGTRRTPPLSALLAKAA